MDQVLHDIALLHIDLVQAAKPLSIILPRAQLIALKLGDIETANLMGKEMSGYGIDRISAIPLYREIYGVFRWISPSGKLCKTNFTEEQERTVGRQRLSQSVADLEVTHADVPADDLYVLPLSDIQEAVFERMKIPTGFYLERRELTRVLQQIRNFILSWSVTHEKALLAQGFKPKAPQPPQVINNISGNFYHSQIQQSTSDSSQNQEGTGNGNKHYSN